MNRYDVALVGGGIVGACLAEELAGTGARVLVLDAGEEPGHATARAAGVAVPSLRYLDDPEFYAWLSLGQEALTGDIRRLEPGHGEFSVRSPLIRMLRRDDADLVRSLLPEDSGARWSTADQLSSDGFRLPEDRHYLVDRNGLMVDGSRYLRAVRASALSSGVEWLQGTTVSALEPDATGVRVLTPDTERRADRVVVTAGAWSGLPGLTSHVPVTPQRGELVRLGGVEPPPWILSSAHYLAPDTEGGVIVGATEENAGFDTSPTVAGTSRLLRYALALAPHYAGAVPLALQAGLRPVTPTGRPLVGRVPGQDRVLVAAGHAGHGLLSARLTARGLTAAMDRGEWDGLPFSFCPTENLRRAEEVRA
ncbi:NAD(P)/FAD-dependent oxidoreductase [Nocardiopsis alba]|uniref:NAD(P)/FAD-dependent oxidoreductase n=1 Tax=Nocardiopsis alba TaxID=53437 RepID=UPI00366551D8